MDKVRKRASGAGVKADDGAKPLNRRQILLDEASEALFLQVGDGNLSLGAREIARRLAECGDVAPFDLERHQKRTAAKISVPEGAPLVPAPQASALATTSAKKQRPLKLYLTICDNLSEMSSLANGSKQAELIICAHSKAEVIRACDALKVYYYRKNEICDLPRRPEFDVAFEQPGVLFWKPLSSYGVPYKPVQGKTSGGAGNE